MYGLAAEDVQNIRNAIARVPLISKVILYGSRAKGNYRPGSDIDLTLLGKNLTLKNSVYPLMDALEELNLPYTFDISIYSRIDNDDLLAHIQRVGEVFYRREAELPEGWEVKNLSELFNVKSSKRVLKADWQTDGIPFYRAREIVKLAQFGEVNNELFISRNLYKKFTKQKGHPQAGDIVISAVGTLGHCYLVKNTDEFYFKDASVLWFEKKSTVDSNYIAYLFKSDFVLDQVMAHSMGATVGTLTITRAKKIQIPLPPLPEQKRIVAILDKAFEGINQAVANAEKNLANGRELFESYLNTIFTRKGDGWEEKKLVNLGQITSSKRIFKREYTDTGIPFYRTKEIKEKANGRNITTKLYISEERYYEIKNKFGVPQAGDILITAIGTIGEIFVVGGVEEFYFKDGNVLWLKKFEAVNPYFLRYILMSFVENLRRLSHGSAYNALPIQKLKNHIIFLPPEDKQKEIVSQLDALFAQSQNLESIYKQKLKALTELKQSILQKAFSGELTTNTIQ